ncbi:hypothetical protein KC19_6G222200 [Ceratodon purpureus]|nr:hypothetical protein KC19_6G222200 [Ceratodon purpureus]
MVPLPNRMRLSWTTPWTTADMRFDEEPRMALFLLRDSNPMELVPEFLNALMDTTLMVQDEARRKKYSKHKKARQLAMRFSGLEKVRKRTLLRQAPGSEVIRGGLDGLVVKSEFPGSTPIFNSSTVSYGPASGLSTPTHPPILTALDGRAQHELRTPMKPVSSSKPLNLGMYNAGKLVSEQETSPLFGHQTPFCFDRPHALGSYVGVSHGQLKSIPSGYHAIGESKRQQAQARNEPVQVPMTDDHDFFLDRVGSSQLKLPVKVDVCNGMAVGPPPKHSPDFTARLYGHGLSSWAIPSRPSTFHDVPAHQTLHRSPTCDKGVMSYEPRKLGVESLDGSGWINPRKSSSGVESRSTFGIASQGREGIIMLSDSDEETYHNDDEMGASVMDDDDFLARKRCWMTTDDGWQAEDIGRQTKSRKRKERDASHDNRTDPRDRNSLDTKVCVLAATAARIKVESEKHASTFNYGSRAQLKPVYHTADNRSEKFTSTFNHESRAQWNTWISEAKTEVPSWEARTQNRGSCHIVDQSTKNVVNTSSPSDLEDLHTLPSLKKLDRNLDVLDFPQSDSEHLQSPTETQNFNIPPSGSSVRERQEDIARNFAEQPERSYTREIGKSKNWVASDDLQPENEKMEREVILVENDDESDSVEEHVYEAGVYKDDDGMIGIGESAAKKLQNRERLNVGSVRPIERGAGGRKFPGRRGRPPGAKSQLHPKPTKSVSLGATICNDGRTQSDIDPRNTSSQRFLRAARPVGRPKHCNSYGHAPAADYVVKKNLVDVDQDFQKAVPDSDYYCFDGDRGKEKIKPNQVWALYDDIDTMPRTLIRVKEVSMNGPFWVKAIWLQPQNWSKKSGRQKKAGFPISCGDFEEPKESTVIRALNCFSHKMEFTPKTDTVIQVYPRKGEIWALYHKDNIGDGLKQARSEKDRKGKGNDCDKYQFRLVVIVSNCGEARETEILVLRKRTGYRTLWEPGYKKGSLPVEYMERFSHRVPAYKLTEKDYPDLNNLDIWDIDAAAVPACQSKVT